MTNADVNPAVMRRLAIYAHYDADNEIKPYVHFALNALREHCSKVVFISHSALSEAELETLVQCDQKRGRENVGYDFAMWKEAIAEHELSQWDELVISNSSVVGPVLPLGPIFSKMQAAQCDFWGVSDNLEHDWHLQSYFVVFKSQVLHSPAFLQFWNSVLPYQSKWQIILSYELGLSTFLGDAGFRGAALVAADTLFPPWPLRLLYRHSKRNPSIRHPLRLLERGMPFVKVELLRDNPTKVVLKPLYVEMARCGYDLAMLDFSR